VIQQCDTSESRSEITEGFEMWYRRWMGIICTDRVRNEKVLQKFEEETKILLQQKEGRLTGLVTPCVGTAL